jgi:hypothetical protein
MPSGGQKPSGDRTASGGGMPSGGMGGGMDAINGLLLIDGGKLTVDAAGDGLDSNGSILINGGYTVVSGSVDGGNAALDYNGDCEMNDGVLILSGNSGMAQALNDSSKESMAAASSNDTIAAGTEVVLTDDSGKELYRFTVAKDCNYLQIAAPEIDSTGSYSFVIDGTSTAATVS